MSCLENMHCSKLFQILAKHECNLFSELNEAQLENLGALKLFALGGSIDIGSHSPAQMIPELVNIGSREDLPAKPETSQFQTTTVDVPSKQSIGQVSLKM